MSESSEVLIRPMEEGDLPAVHRIESRCYTNPWSIESFRYEMKLSPVSRFFVATDRQSSVLGYIGLWLIEDEIHVNNLAVSPERRRRGVASALLRFVLTSKTVGAASATLEVRRSNGAAIALYRRFGFVEVGLRRGYYVNPPEDALIMTKPIDR